jgi:hypothetical protein
VRGVLFRRRLIRVRNVLKLSACDHRTGISAHQDDEDPNDSGHRCLFCLFERGYQGLVSSHLAKVVFGAFRGLVNSLYSVNTVIYLPEDCAKPASRNGARIMSKRENILSSLREKPLKVFEIMRRANISNEESCQSLLLRMRDEGSIKFDIQKGRWSIG